MQTNDIYQQAVADRAATGERYGVARVTLQNGETIICSVRPVAGCAIVNKHDRIKYGIIRNGQQYAKPISRAAVAKLLREQH